MDLILERFIQHKQLFEYIELFQIYLREETSDGKYERMQLPLIPGRGKNFMHLAVEYNSY